MFFDSDLGPLIGYVADGSRHVAVDRFEGIQPEVRLGPGHPFGALLLDTVPARLGDRQTAIPRGKARRVDHRVRHDALDHDEGEAMLRGQGAPHVTSRFDVVRGVDHDVQPGGQMCLSQRRSNPVGGEAGLETARDTGPDDRGLDGIHRQDGTPANPPDCLGDRALAGAGQAGHDD